MTAEATLRVATCNLHEGGLDAGMPGPRWNQHMQRLSELSLDVLFVQELHGWEREGGALLFAAEEQLDMRGLFAPAPMVDCHLGIFIRAGRIRPKRWDLRYSPMAWHAYAQATLTMVGLATPLTAVSVHLSPWSPEQRLIETAVIAQNVGKARWGIAAGDFNAVPPGDPEPPWDRMPQRKQAQAITTDGAVQADRRPGQRLSAAGLVDAARAHAAATGGGDPPITGEHFRNDQIWTTPTIGVKHVEAVNTGLSDHRLVVAELEVRR